MDHQHAQITFHFKGKFIPDSSRFADKLKGIKAYVFDWDGVFNDGYKNDAGSSPFNEVDSMGINLLRFSHWLRTGEQAVIAIISGESNGAAKTFAKRENLHALYSGSKNKVDALKHLSEANGFRDKQTCYVFDDVLDLSAAKAAGMRIMVPHGAGSLLQQYILDHELVDYITDAWGHQQAVREVSELLMFIGGNYTTAIDHRVAYSESYKKFVEEKKAIATSFWKTDASGIIESTHQ